MTDFKAALDNKIRRSRFNDFGKENYDELRFGKYRAMYPRFSFISFRQFIKRIIGYIPTSSIEGTKYMNGLQRMYENLNQQGKELLVDLMAYRQLGFQRIKLARNNKEFAAAIESANSLTASNETYDPKFMHFILEKLDLNPIGFNIKLFFLRMGVAIEFIVEQYVYKLNNKRIVSVEKGDVVLDLGACWGETALYFAQLAGESGKVYSFEFIPGNIKVFAMNRALNPHLAERIELVEFPISNTSGETIYYKDHGPGSRVEKKAFEGQTGKTTTITIDDLVKQKNIKKVDFIKMDIEGSEPYALQGALETIKRFKPKLAIAIYHSLDDMVNIPNWILDLNLGYEIFIDHYTIHGEETVCFAKVKDPLK